jgi:glycosyltransferase involved in cell wall biosynthesis
VRRSESPYRPDYVVHGETGYLVKSESELSAKLGLLLSDQDLRLEMSAAAARHALQFDWDKIARDLRRPHRHSSGLCPELFFSESSPWQFSF